MSSDHLSYEEKKEDFKKQLTNKIFSCPGTFGEKIDGKWIHRHFENDDSRHIKGDDPATKKNSDNPELESERNNPELESDRHPFIVDRDRIAYAAAFRKSRAKTHSISAKYSDETRTRLMHALEVTQIARTISSKLGLNDNLTDAIALGHDLGQPAFGPVGVQTLNLIMNGCADLPLYFQSNDAWDDKGFDYSIQTVRQCVRIEKRYLESKGLDLTNFTLFGLKSYSGDYDEDGKFVKRDEKGKNIKCEYWDNGWCFRGAKSKECRSADGVLENMQLNDTVESWLKIPNDKKYAWSLEVFVVFIANEIAKRHQDIEDGLNMGIFTKDDILNKIKDCYAKIFAQLEKPANQRESPYSIEDLWSDVKCRELTNSWKELNEAKEIRIRYFLPKVSGLIISLMIADVTANAKNNLFNEIYAEWMAETEDKREAFINWYRETNMTDAKEIIAFSQDFKQCDREFKNYLKDHIQNSHMMQKTIGQGSQIIRKLYQAFLNNPLLLSDDYLLMLLEDYCQLDKKENLTTISNPNDRDNSISDEFRKILTTKDTLRKEYNDIYYEMQYPAIVGRARETLSKKLTVLYQSDHFCNCLYRTIADYITQMTDQEALREYYIIYG